MKVDPYFLGKVAVLHVLACIPHVYTTLTSRWNPMWWVEPSLDEFGHPSSRPFACCACVKCLSNGWSPGWLNLATRRVGPLHALPSEKRIRDETLDTACPSRSEGLQGFGHGGKGLSEGSGTANELKSPCNMLVHVLYALPWWNLGHGVPIPE